MLFLNSEDWCDSRIISPRPRTKRSFAWYTPSQFRYNHLFDRIYHLSGHCLLRILHLAARAALFGPQHEPRTMGITPDAGGRLQAALSGVLYKFSVLIFFFINKDAILALAALEFAHFPSTRSLVQKGSQAWGSD